MSAATSGAPTAGAASSNHVPRPSGGPTRDQAAHDGSDPRDVVDPTGTVGTDPDLETRTDAATGTDAGTGTGTHTGTDTEGHIGEADGHDEPTVVEDEVPATVDRTANELLLLRLAETDPDDPAYAALRDAVVTSHLPLVHHIARRFGGRGEPHDDVVQVGTIGLIKAVDRFEAARGVPFAGYAVPTVTGEIRRYFRDRAGSVRLPRRVQEVQVAVTQSRESLTHELGRTPTVEEVAQRAGLDTDTVLEVLESAYSLSTVPLDVDNGVSDSLGEEDVALDEVLTRATLRPVLAKLEPRERRIIALRFVRGLSQAQIAEEVGLSQMHVSRLLSRILAKLRAEMSRPDPVDE